MNKETRTFILGLILATIGGTAMSLHIVALRRHEFGGIFDWVLLITSILACIKGVINISNTTD